jgi:hypothetical protein
MTSGFEVTETIAVDNRPGASVIGRLLGGAVARHGDVLVDGGFRARIESVGILGADRVQLVLDVAEAHELQAGQLLAIETPSY